MAPPTGTGTGSGTRRVAFVTGAAHGIGRATAGALLREGWTVGAFDIDEEGLAGLAEVAARHATTVVTGHLDVRDQAGWSRALDRVVDDRLDLLVNNAGVLASGPFVETPLERHRALVEVNVIGVVNGAHTAFDHLRRTPGSTLVNLGSASAMYGQPDLATYSATKFAVRGLTEALQLEWAGHGIRVLDLWPLFVATDMVRDLHSGAARTLGVRLSEEQVAAALLAAVEGGRPGRRGPRLLGRTHHPVGRQARLLWAAAQVSPAWANRRLTRLLSRR